MHSRCLSQLPLGQKSCSQLISSFRNTDFAMNVMPWLPWSLFSRHSWSIGVVKVSIVLIQQSGKQFMIWSVPTTVGQIKATNKGYQSEIDLL